MVILPVTVTVFPGIYFDGKWISKYWLAKIYAVLQERAIELQCNTFSFKENPLNLKTGSWTYLIFIYTL